MNAKVADVDALDVQQLAAEAQQVLEGDDPARHAILTFATQHELHQFDPARLQELGHTLHEAIERALRPDPVDIGRADIHG